MKNFSFLFMSIIICSGNLFSQIWTPHNCGSVNLLYGISFPTNDTGYVIDEFGSIRKTIDGANSWSAVPSPATFVYSIVFNTGQIGFSIGDSLIYKTTNGGTSWNPVMNDTEVILTNIFFADALTGYATSMKNSGDSVRLYKTSNGGNSWSTIGAKEFMGTEQSLYFINATTGFWGTNYNIFSTIDGGSSFSSVYNDLTGNQLFVNFAFPTIDTGYAIDYLSIVRTENGGATWSAVNFPGPIIYDAYFSTGNKGFVCGGNGINAGWVSQTSDGGMTWSPSYTSSYTFDCMDFPSDTVGYVGGSNGTVLKFTGILSSLQEQNVSYPISVFPNPANGSTTLTNIIPGSEIRLVNISGAMLFKQTSTNSILKLNLENFPAGIYFIEIISDKGRSIQKMIKL